MVTSRALVGSSRMSGTQGQGSRDGDPLALSTRELVREPSRDGPRERDLVEQVAHARLSLGLAADAVRRQRLLDRPVDRVLRIQRCVRVLEHRLHLAAERQLLLLGAQRRDVDAVELDRAAGGRQQVQHHPRDGGLARAGLAHEAQRGALVQGQTDPVHGPDHFFRPLKKAAPGGFEGEGAGDVGKLDERRTAGARFLHARGHGPEQVAGVVLLRPGEDLGQGAALDHPAAVHDRDRVRDLAHHGQVVGDEQHGHAELGLEIADERQDLLLDGHVQGGGRLVGDEQLGLAGQGHGDDHPLALAAGELVRVAGEAVFRVVDAGAFQSLRTASASAPLAVMSWWSWSISAIWSPTR